LVKKLKKEILLLKLIIRGNKMIKNKITALSLGLILGYTNLSADVIPGINSKGRRNASS